MTRKKHGALVEYHRNEDRNLASNYVQMLVNVSFNGHIPKDGVCTT